MFDFSANNLTFKLYMVIESVPPIRRTATRPRFPSGKTVREDLPRGPEWQRITTALVRALGELSRQSSWEETAAHYGVDGKIAATAVERAVAWRRKHRSWKAPHIIVIDAVSRQDAALPDAGLRSGAATAGLDRGEPGRGGHGALLCSAGQTPGELDPDCLL